MIRVLSQAALSPLLPPSHHCGCWALGPGLLPLPCPPAAGGATRAHTRSATTFRRRGTVPPTPSSYLRGSHVLPASSSARHAINLPCGPLSASRAPHPAQGPQGLPPPPAPSLGLGGLLEPLLPPPSARPRGRFSGEWRGRFPLGFFPLPSLEPLCRGAPRLREGSAASGGIGGWGRAPVSEETGLLCQVTVG